MNGKNEIVRDHIVIFRKRVLVSTAHFKNVVSGGSKDRLQGACAVAVSFVEQDRLAGSNINTEKTHTIHSVEGKCVHVGSFISVLMVVRKYDLVHIFSEHMIYKSFEEFIIRIMVSCLNHDHSAFEEKHGIALGRHINDDVCEFLITKGGYFDFRGYSGLLDMLKGTIGNDHTFVSTIKKERYKTCINKMCAARNYAAHNSKQSKNAVKKVFNAQSISSAGSFLKSARRMADIIESLKALADEVKAIDLY